MFFFFILMSVPISKSIYIHLKHACVANILRFSREDGSKEVTDEIIMSHNAKVIF